MDLPLELGPLGQLELRATMPASPTRLELAAGTDCVELGVRDVQELAGALLLWLEQNGHDGPDLPGELEDVDDPEPDSQPPRGAYGALVVSGDHGRPLIDRADPWVLASTELLDQLRTARPFAVVDGLELTLHDAAGAVAVYVMRPQLQCATGSMVLERTTWRPAGLPDVRAIPEHTRG